MSLTTELADQSSPLSRHLKSRFPNTRTVLTKVNPEFNKLATRKPDGEFPYQLVGAAVDYRIRYMFPDPEPARRTIAGIGYDTLRDISHPATQHKNCMLQIRSGKGAFNAKAIRDFFAETDTFVAEVKPAYRQLESAHEQHLARHCLVLAILEGFARSRGDHGSLLKNEMVHTSRDLLELIRQSWIEDLTAISQAVHTALEPYFGQPYVPNPTFDGSADVGGADADIIIGDTLFEIKTTIKPGIRTEWLRQIMAYALLDYDDRYCIRNLGFILPRQAHVLTWTLQDLMFFMSNATASALEKERQDFQDAICRRRSPWP